MEAPLWIIWTTIILIIWFQIISKALSAEGKALREQRRVWLVQMREEVKRIPELKRFIAIQVWFPRVIGLIFLAFSIALVIWEGGVKGNILAVYALGTLIAPLWLLCNGYYSSD